MAIINCYDVNGDAIRSLTQWDHDISIRVTGVKTSPIPEFRFSNKNSQKSKCISGVVVGDGVKATIPNGFLQEALPIYVQLFYTYPSGDAKTEHTFVIPVKPASMPDGAVYEPVEVRSVVELEKRVKALEENGAPGAGGVPSDPSFDTVSLGGDAGVVIIPEGTADAPAITFYGARGDEPVALNNVADAIDDRSAPNLGQVKQLVEAHSGQNPGQDGEDGATFTPAVSEDGTLSWTNDKGLDNPAPINIKGPQGERGLTGETGPAGYTPQKGVDYFDGQPGKDGKDGADGKTPVRGTDYWTPADKAEIVAMVIESLGGNPIFGTVDENNNIIVSGDLPDGTYSVKYEMANGTTVNIGNLVLDTNVYYTVTNTLTNCTNSNSATQAVEGDSYSATIAAKSGYELESVVVTMGGSPVTVNGGTISIAEVTGNIVITAVAEEVKVNYTNLADPASADWAEGKRLDGSGGLKDVDAGVNGATTNYIGGGFAVGDTIRIKGMDLSGSSYRTAVYDKNKNLQSLSTLSGQGTYFSDIVVNSTGASFKIKSNVPSDGYMRFSGVLNGTSADVIITKNEEIA